MPKQPSRPLAPGEPQKLLARARCPRDRALIVLLWRGGLRAAEACGLETTDCELLPAGGMRVHVRHGKGDRARFVGLDPQAAAIVAPLLARAPGPLLRTGKGQPIHPTQVRRTIRLLAAGAGIRGRVHPHALRHTFARELHDEGFSVRDIQVALGHTSLATTQVYRPPAARPSTSSRSWR